MSNDDQLILSGVTPEFLKTARAQYEDTLGKLELLSQFKIVTHPKTPHILYDLAAFMILKEKCEALDGCAPLVKICDMGIEHLNKVLEDKQAVIRQAEEIGDGLVSSSAYNDSV